MSIEKKFDPAKRKKLNNPIRLEWIPSERIAALLEMERGGAYLDIGAGTGYISREVAAKVSDAKVHVVDIEPLMIEEIKRNTEGGRLFPQLMERDILPFPERSMDGVWSIAVFHELGKAAPLLREVRRVLRPGGHLLVVDWEKAAEACEQGPPLDHRVSAQEVIDELRDAGFHDVQAVAGFTHHFAVLARN